MIVYSEGPKALHAVLKDDANKANSYLAQLDHEQIVMLIEAVQRLRDLATIVLAERDPGYPGVTVTEPDE